MRTAKSRASRCWWPVLLLVGLSAQAQDDVATTGDATQAEAAPEFLDFLEYLGSWDGQEQDWVQFIDADEQVPRDAESKQAEPEQVEIEEVNDVVS